MSNQQLYKEEELLNDLRNGSEGAFEQIFKLYWQPLYAIARSKLRSHEEAEEVIQGIFSTIWEKRHTLLITNLSHYLQTCVRNRVINHIRLRITQEKYWEYYKHFIPQHKDITEDLVAFDNLSEAVDEAVSRLPEKSRQVFQLNRLEGRSKKEIAKLLRLSEKAIEYHLTKSLKELRIHLKDFIFMLTFFVV